MFLHEIYSKDRIVLHLNDMDKERALKMLVGRLAESTGTERGEEFLKVILDREKLMSTGINNGIAIPHGKIDNLDGIVGVVGISDKGINYDSLDNKPTRLMFLFISNRTKYAEHLMMLNRISVIAGNQKFLKEFLLAENPETANLILKKYETKPAPHRR
ncbi:MAG: PTS sugar transporter subunit IIA [Victivallales bacterium]|jgi:PTS system fructose-specific IIC component/PTS system nitrogen regulatory IIA component